MLVIIEKEMEVVMMEDVERVKVLKVMMVHQVPKPSCGLCCVVRRLERVNGQRAGTSN